MESNCRGIDVSSINNGDAMGIRKMRSYYQIFEQIYSNPNVPLCEISQKTGLARNTVSKYTKEMYTRNVLVGPYLALKPALNYQEYVYLMRVTEPFSVVDRLKEDSHVVYYAVTFGDWNIMVITDEVGDFSQVPVESVVYQGVKGYCYTPKVGLNNWNESFRRMHEEIASFNGDPHKERRNASLLEWGEDQWKLCYAFKNNVRRKVIPTLKKIKVGYETYAKWMNTLKDHCTIHTGFYPEGYHTYMNYCFLVRSEYELMVKSLAALLPVTPFVAEIGNQMLVMISASSPWVTRSLFCVFCDMKTKNIIKRYQKAGVLFCNYEK